MFPKSVRTPELSVERFDGLVVPAPRREPQPVFAALGPLRVWNGSTDCAPRTPKVLQVLSLLVVRTNRIVSTEAIIEELWGERIPRTALTTIQTYIYQLRRLIEREQLATSGEQMLVTQSPGYLLQIQAGQLDLERFGELRARGRQQFAHGRFAEASTDLRAALHLWTQDPLANVKLGTHLKAHVLDLQEQHRTTAQLAIEADIELGRHRELVPELSSLTTRHSTDEWFHRQLMRVLDRCGRRSDALHVYWSLRSTLGQELGIEPSQETQRLHVELLE